MRSTAARALFAALLVATTALTAPREARADELRVLVLPFTGEVPGAADGADRFTKVTARAAGLTGATVVEGQASFDDAATLAGCSEQTAECLGQIAAALRADKVVLGHVSASADGKSVIVALKVFESGALSEKTLTFPQEGIDKLVQRMAREASNLFVPGEEPPPHVEEPAPAPAAAPAPAPPPVEREEPSRGRVLPWIVLGAGAALGATGGVFFYLGRDRQKQVDRAPTSDVDDFERLVELEDEGERYTLLGVGLMAAGGAAIAAGVVLFLIGGGDDDDASATALAPLAVDGGVGLSFTWRTP